MVMSWMDPRFLLNIPIEDATNVIAVEKRVIGLAIAEKRNMEEDQVVLMMVVADLEEVSVESDAQAEAVHLRDGKVLKEDAVVEVLVRAHLHEERGVEVEVPFGIQCEVDIEAEVDDCNVDEDPFRRGSQIVLHKFKATERIKDRTCSFCR